MQQFMLKVWYHNHTAKWLLWPLSWLFIVITALRKCLFACGLKPSVHLAAPVIIVGNITVGGSGKTPTVIYLIELLRQHGYRPGVISRGYGVKIDGVKAVLPGATATEVGDEPAMIVARTGVPMVVGADRIAAGEQLLQQFEVDVIISDDGLQHYRLARDIELVVIDGERRLGNGMRLPAGPLREAKTRLNGVDGIIVNGGRAQANEYEMSLAPSGFHNVSQPDLKADHEITRGVAMAGIGNPQRFFNSLTELKIELTAQYSFDDHHNYEAAELTELAQGQPLLMTEKDAVKCREFATQDWWYLAVNAKLSAKFDQMLLDKLQQAKTKLKG
ncbi:tetraacyldisaccharide 4'-kinase [Shewanella marina]|uniref:tetraacyldisaccharide 4'-kinase n=1 Tax=Shewanella marina TaxID=487319 RepID=UPI000472388F|nr:tetraacyldisaccharide 4'-kinase [Shewanella marina]